MDVNLYEMRDTTIVDQLSYTENAPMHTDHCDRRLSRAARAILVNRTLPILQHYDEHLHDMKLSTLSFEDKMDYYKMSVSNLMKNPKTCLLNPKKDMYWHDENLHKITKSRHKRFPKHNFYICGLCGKKFISRYYLDQHVHTKHGNDHVPSKSNPEICPAKELCDRLGSNVCEQRAAADEPYYAPGVHTHDSMYSKSVKRKFHNEAQSKPCSDTSVKACHEMFETCFEGNDGLVKDLSSLFCDTQSCHIQLHSILNSVVSIHDDRELWNMYQEDINSFGWGPSLFIVFATAYYFSSIQKFVLNKMKKKRVWEKTKMS